jgi:ABC-type Fe3+ transport system substrate-binding protein
MKRLLPDCYEDFLANTVFQGSPVDVKNAVDEGRYPLGIANVSFSRFARQKNIGVVWPAEGAFFAIQVIVWGKDADNRLLDLCQYLVSRPMQEFFAHQGYIPVIPDVALPPEAEENNCRLIWEGWDRFFEIYAGI